MKRAPWNAKANDNLPGCQASSKGGARSDPDLAGQHISQAILERATRPATYHSAPDHRPALLAWAQGVVAASESFRSTVLMGTFSRNTTAAAAAAAAAAPTVPPSPLSKLRGLPDALELVADFVGGVRRGRELRNAREFAECLVAMGTANDGAVAAVAAAE